MKRDRLASLSGAFYGCHPAKEEEVVPAHRAPIGQQDKVDGALNSVARTNAPEFDRLAMGTTSG
jgi:hypothetical protein